MHNLQMGIITVAALNWEATLWITLSIGICVSLLALSCAERILRPAKAPVPEPAKCNKPSEPSIDLGIDMSNKRFATRRTGNPIKILLTDKEMKAAYRHGWVIDRSQGGLRLAVPDEEKEGAILSVRVAEQGSMPWIELRVKHCSEAKHGYELGCEFVRPPNFNWLMMFG